MVATSRSAARFTNQTSQSFDQSLTLGGVIPADCQICNTTASGQSQRFELAPAHRSNESRDGTVTVYSSRTVMCSIAVAEITCVPPSPICRVGAVAYPGRGIEYSPYVLA